MEGVTSRRGRGARKWLKTPETSRGPTVNWRLLQYLYKFSDHDRDEEGLECQILTRLPRHLIGSNDAERLKDPAFGERAARLVNDLVHDFADAGYEDFAECVSERPRPRCQSMCLVCSRSSR